jgi:voltage-gated sodium channel
MSENQQPPGLKATLAAWVETPLMTGLLTWLILGNAFSFGLLTYDTFISGINARFAINLESWLTLFDHVVIIVFTLEVAVRIWARGKSFFRDGWNIFDLIVVATSLIGQWPIFAVLRILRVLRLARLLKQIQSLRLISSIILKSVTGCVSITFLMILVLFIFALAGHALFGKTNPELFGALHTGMYTLFRVAALADLESVAAVLIKDYPYAYFFLLPYFLLMSYVIMNFFGGIIIYYLYEFSFDEVKSGKVIRDESGESPTAEEASATAPGAADDQYQALMQELGRLREEIQELKRV